MGQRTLKSNIVLNFAGQAIPVAAVAGCMPILARTLGLERLGLLSLAWVLIGSFGMLDLGMGRALTQAVSAALAIGKAHTVRTLLIIGTLLLFAVGVAGAIVLTALSPWLIDHYFRISPLLRHEAIVATYLLGVGLPFMLASSSQRGFLEAHQRFDLVNLVRAPVGALNYVGPLAALPFSHSVAVCVGIVTLTRVAACLVYASMCWSLLPPLKASDSDTWRESLGFVQTGTWMTAANLAGAALAYADRFVLTGAVSVTALAYYAAPQEIITKLTVVPMTAGAVVFPAFSALAALRSERGTHLFEKMSLYSFAILLPVALTAAALAPTWLTVWLGSDFASQSAGVAQLFCFGTFLNSLAVTPSLFLQGSGRADLAAKIQCVQLPFYVACLWLAAVRYGIQGVAFVWFARMFVDAGLLYLASKPLLSPASTIIGRQSRLLLAPTAAFLIIWWSQDAAVRILALIAALAWLALEVPDLLFDDDRAYAISLWKRARATFLG